MNCNRIVLAGVVSAGFGATAHAQQPSWELGLERGVELSASHTPGETSFVKDVARSLGTSASSGAGVADNTFLKVRAAAFFAEANVDRAVGGSVGGAVSTIDLNNAVNVDPDSVVPIGSVELAIPTPVFGLKIDVGFLGTHELDGSVAAPAVPIAFNGQQFGANVNTNDEFEFIEANAMFELLELSPFDAVGIKLHAGPGVRFVTYRSEIAGELVGAVPGTVTTSSEEVFVPLPVINGSARVDFLDHFFAFGEVGWIELGDFASVVDVTAEVGYDFFRNAGVFVGYRTIYFENDTFDIELDLNLEGWYVGAELRL